MADTTRSTELQNLVLFLLNWLRVPVIFRGEGNINHGITRNYCQTHEGRTDRQLAGEFERAKRDFPD